MKVAITGSSGLIGTALTASLQADGHQVVRLVRRPPRARRRDPLGPARGRRGQPGPDRRVRLRAPGRAPGSATTAGPPPTRRRSGPAGCWRPGRSPPPWRRLSPRPLAFISGSAIGWYGDTGGAAVTEDAPAGKGFLSRVVADWEAAAAPARDGRHPGRPRSAAASSSAPAAACSAGWRSRPASACCPGSATARQVMSWISLTDEVRAIRFLLDGPAPLAAAVRTTSPRPTRSPTRS